MAVIWVAANVENLAEAGLCPGKDSMDERIPNEN